MEFLVRSQDKMSLTKVDCLSLKKFGVFPNHIIVAYMGNNIIDLGIYKTKERALEVLDEIQNILYKISSPDLENVTDLSKQLYIPPFIIYEMPQE